MAKPAVGFDLEMKTFMWTLMIETKSWEPWYWPWRRLSDGENSDNASLSEGSRQCLEKINQEDNLLQIWSLFQRVSTQSHPFLEIDIKHSETIASKNENHFHAWQCLNVWLSPAPPWCRCRHGHFLICGHILNTSPLLPNFYLSINISYRLRCCIH